MTRFCEIINNWMGWCPNVQMLPNAPTSTTIPPAPAQNEPAGGGDAGSGGGYRRRRRGFHSLVPAGLLIGLGVGLLVGHVAAAGLVGLGLGFLGSAVLKTQPSMDEQAAMSTHAKAWLKGHGYDQDISGQAVPSPHKHRLGVALLGIFFIIFGIVVVWAPVLLWPYIGAAFLILLGIGILVHSFLHHGHDHWC